METTELEQTDKKRNSFSKVMLFVIILGMLTSISFSIILNPFSLNQSINELLIKICFAISGLTFLTYLEMNQDENDVSFNWSKFLRWTYILVPILFLLQEIDVPNSEKTFVDIFILIVNIIIWCAFVCLYSVELIKAHNQDYRNWVIYLCSIWLVIGVIQILCYLPATRKSFELITGLESINIFFSLKSVLVFSFIIYALVYIVNEIDFKNISKVPKISFLNSTKKTKYSLINGFIKALQSIVNIFISILNPIIQIIGNVLIFFFYEIPRLIYQLIKKFGKISLLILPSIVIICLLILIGYLIINYSTLISEYVASIKRIEGKAILWPKTIGILSLFIASIASVKLTWHISYLKTAQKDEFNIGNLSFAIIYLLFLMTIVGVILYFSLKKSGYELGIFSLVFSIISGIGLIWLIVSQFANKNNVDTD